MEDNLPSTFFYPELPPREIFVDPRSEDDSASPKKNGLSSMSTLNQETKDSGDGEKLPKARFFTFEGLTPVSTVDDTREDHGDIVGLGASPLVGPRPEETDGDREAPPPVPAPAHQPLRCWSLEEETPFDEDPIIAPKVPRSCPAQIESAPVEQAAQLPTLPDHPEPARLDTISDVSETSSTAAGKTKEPVAEAVKPVSDAPQPSVAPIPDGADVPHTAEAVLPGVVSPPFTAKRNPSSLLDDEDDEDDGIIAKEYDVVMAPSDELEDSRIIESILREAEASGGCDVDICKHLTNSSNDICSGFSKLLPI